MDLDKVQALLRLVNESGVAEVEVEEDGFKLVIRRQSATVMMQAPQSYPMPQSYAMPQGFPMQTGYPPMQPPAQSYAPPPAQAAAPAPAAAPAAPAAPATPAEPGSGAGEILVRAPIVGTFYRASSPDADPFVKVGARVEEDDTLCIIEAMKLMNEIKCEQAGTIKEILVENAQAVEYDQPLFVLTP
ncbi:MAG: acetyl-CoA carboxylase biotin carboxyl carrier protein [Rhodothermales bacterium]